MRKNIKAKTFRFKIACFLYIKDSTKPFGADPSYFTSEEFEYSYLELNFQRVLIEGLKSKFNNIKEIQLFCDFPKATKDIRNYQLEIKRLEDNKRVQGYADIIYLGAF
jgi:hypothetical protein